MATSRTGTARYKRWRTQVLALAQRDGVTHCPICKVKLNYEVTRQPDSAEPDHLVPWARGGQETIDNGRVLCRDCNGKRWNEAATRRKSVSTPIESSPIW